MKTLILLLLTFFCSGCSIGRVYEGSPLAADPKQVIQNQKTTRFEILKRFGPPDEVKSQKDGYLFVYRYKQTNNTRFALQAVDPISFARLKVFEYNKSNQKEDALVVLFNQSGIVQNYGLTRTIQDLTLF